jgi:hypothetical protein
MASTGQGKGEEGTAGAVSGSDSDRLAADLRRLRAALGHPRRRKRFGGARAGSTPIRPWPAGPSQDLDGRDSNGNSHQVGQTFFLGHL